jgi:hypothetical protein
VTVALAPWLLILGSFSILALARYFPRANNTVGMGCHRVILVALRGSAALFLAAVRGTAEFILGLIVRCRERVLETGNQVKGVAVTQIDMRRYAAARYFSWQ